MSADALNGVGGTEEYSDADIPADVNLTAGSDVIDADSTDDADIMAQAMGDYDEPSEDDARLIELVGFLVQGIVAHPDEVEVEEFLDDVGSIYGIRVHPEDIGRVIGREGRVANALRHVVKAAATKTGARVQVEIITDDDEPQTVADSADGEESSTQSGDAA
jgi:predicted RNA-binding protein YlqC (UPF0109 family)